ncbi:globin [Rhipicephalus sanguineus]|nr:globin [Rhipicephalus sanguineus]
MGNLWVKDRANKQTGMTRRENKLVQTTWNTFCRKHPDFGSLLLLAMFTQHPDYQALFPKFKGRELRQLRDDAKFRAFGQAVGRQLTAIVDSVDDYDALLTVARKNAVEHAHREGVQAEHFEGFFSAALSQMIEGNKSAMKAAAITAWEKFFETLKMITKHAFDEAAKEAENSKRAASSKSAPRDVPPSSTGNPAYTVTSSLASPANATQKATNTKSPLAVKSVIKGAHSERQSFWKSGAKGKGGKKSP